MRMEPTSIPANTDDANTPPCALLSFEGDNDAGKDNAHHKQVEAIEKMHGDDAEIEL